MIPYVKDRFQMAPSLHIISIPLAALHYIPPAITHALVGLSVGFRLHRGELPSELWSRVYHHRGCTLRDLAENINRCELQQGALNKKQRIMIDLAIASIITFLDTEVRHSSCL